MRLASTEGLLARLALAGVWELGSQSVLSQLLRVTSCVSISTNQAIYVEHLLFSWGSAILLCVRQRMPM